MKDEIVAAIALRYAYMNTSEVDHSAYDLAADLEMGNKIIVDARTGKQDGVFESMGLPALPEMPTVRETVEEVE